MNTQEVPRFDHLWRDAIKWHAVMVKHANGIQTAVRLFRRAAYRFAVAVLLIQKHCHNEFVQFAVNSGFDLNAWLDDHIDAIEQLGDDRRTLMASIEQGMTEKEYLAQGRLWIVRKQIKNPSKIARVDIESKPATEQMTSDEKLDYLFTENQALRSEVRQLRRDLAVALDQNDRLSKAVTRADKLLATVTKSNAGKKIG